MHKQTWWRLLLPFSFFLSVIFVQFSFEMKTKMTGKKRKREVFSTYSLMCGQSRRVDGIYLLIAAVIDLTRQRFVPEIYSPSTLVLTGTVGRGVYSCTQGC